MPRTARSHIGSESAESRKIVVDGGISVRKPGQFLLDHMGRIPYRYVLQVMKRTSISSHRARPVIPWRIQWTSGRDIDDLCYIHHIWCLWCGVTIILPSRLILRESGPAVWDSGILDVTTLDQIPFIVKTVPNIKLNEAFMVFGALGLAFNITARLCPRS
jgi:hypothetical protein